MTVVVAYKYAVNPQNASVGADGTVDWSRAKPAISDYDPIAIEMGRAVADQQGCELVGISVGDSALASSMAKKNAMSRGMDRGVVVADDSTKEWNHTTVAAALAQLVEKVADTDLVLTGDSSVDHGARMMPSLVSAFLNWPCFEQVVGIEKNENGYLITQRVANGTRKIQLDSPAVLAIATDAVTARVPSMKEILAAAKKPLDTVEVASLSLPETNLPVVAKSRPQARERKKNVFTGANAVNDLVAALRGDGLL